MFSFMYSMLLNYFPRDYHSKFQQEFSDLLEEGRIECCSGKVQRQYTFVYRMNSPDWLNNLESNKGSLTQ